MRIVDSGLNTAVPLRALYIIIYFLYIFFKSQNGKDNKEDRVFYFSLPLHIDIKIKEYLKMVHLE